MTRLLAVSWEMPPMYGPRGTQVAATVRELAARGWRPTVVCMGPRRHGPHWPEGTPAEPPAGVELIRVPSLEESLLWRIGSNVVPAVRRFPDGQRLWVGRATEAAERAAREQPFAGVITFAQPWSDHLVGLRLRRSLNARWVAHFSDPWVDSPYASRSVVGRGFSRRLERDVIAGADAVVFVTEETAELVMRKYPSEWRRKVTIVPHGFDPASVPPRTAPLSPPGPMRIVYTGRFYHGIRTPIGLFQALAMLNDRESLTGVLDVLLMGPEVVEYQEDVQAFGLSSIVRFEERRPRADADRAAAQADVLLVIDAPHPSSSVFLPSKLVEYFAFRKLILGLTPRTGASARLLERLECPVAPPDDARAIADALAGLIRRWRTGTLSVGAHFDSVRDEYDIRRTTARLDDVLRATFARAA